MTQRRTRISAETINAALDTESVRDALRARAARVLPRAKAIAFENGADEFAKALRVTEGTRPGTGARSGIKRPYARIGAVITPELKAADGYTPLTRRMILRRGALGS